MSENETAGDAVTKSRRPHAQRRFPMRCGLLMMATGIPGLLFAQSNWYVDANATASGSGQSWTQAFQTIQEGIDAAGAGDTVWVTNGVYQHGGCTANDGSRLTNRVWISKPVRVCSVNGPGVTGIRGVPVMGPAAMRAVRLESNAVLSGFTISDGSTFYSGEAFTECSGGGLLLQPGCMVSNCVIRNNRANSYGGGMLFLDGGAASRCIIRNNYCANQGGGMLFFRGGRLDNCLVIDNAALNRGGGARLTGAPSLLLNCTLTGNTCSNDFGGGIYLDSGATVTNCIIYGNHALGTSSNCAGLVDHSVSYSCTAPLPPGGAGNLAGNPRFVAPAQGLYRLQWTSPCLQAGSMIGSHTDTDLDGAPRHTGTSIDMGCYEAPSGPQNTILFDGTTVAVLPRDPALGTTLTNLSFSLWANLVSASGPQALLWHGIPTDNGHWGIHVNDRRQAVFTLGSSNSGYRLQSSQPLSTGAWYHLALCFDGEQMQGFVNGRCIGTATGGIYSAMDATTWLGCPDTGTAWTAQALLDEVRLWRHAFTPAEQRDHMNRTLTGAEAGLQCSYRFNQRQGRQLPDYSPHALNARIQGTTNPVWRSSQAPVANLVAITQQQVRGAWFSMPSNAALSADTGIAINAAFADRHAYTVYGHNGLSGITTTDIPFGTAQRLARITYFDVQANEPITTITFNPAAAGGTNLQMDATRRYVLLRRGAPQGLFMTLTNPPVVDAHSNVTFHGIRLLSGCYTLGVTTGGWCTLNIKGSPAPYGRPVTLDYGIHALEVQAVVTNTAPTPVPLDSGSRGVCTGWTGTGHIPAIGATNRVIFSLQTNSTLTWHWKTQHQLTAQAVNGTIEGLQNGWKDAGWIFSLIPRAALGFLFDHWTLDSNDTRTAVILTITADAPHQVTANFTAADWDLNATGTLAVAAWRIVINAFGTFTLCNPADSNMRLLDTFLVAIDPHPYMHIRYPDGTTPSGEEYVDVTGQVISNLQATGNKDAVMDPGECVEVGEIEFLGKNTNYLHAIFYTRGIPDLSGTDTDHDGIPNNWEDRELLNLNDPTDSLRDQDGDGVLSVSEYIADTHPFDSDSCLCIRSMHSPDRRVRVEWKGGTAVVQYLEWSPKIYGGNWSVQFTNPPPTPVTNQVDVLEDPSEGYYRIRAVR